MYIKEDSSRSCQFYHCKVFKSFPYDIHVLTVLMQLLYPLPIHDIHLLTRAGIIMKSSLSFHNHCLLIIKSHHVMMTFLVFDLDVLFIPCYSFFFLSFFPPRRLLFHISKLSIESTLNFLCICRTRICSALQNLSDLGTFCDE